MSNTINKLLLIVAVLSIVGCSQDGTDYTLSGNISSNTAPVANAGVIQNVSTGALVTLDAAGSTDTDGDTLSYHWSIVLKPVESGSILSDVSAVNPIIIVDTDGTYLFQLIVNDGKTDSPSSNVVVTASTANSAPVANAGIDQNIYTSALVQLDGSTSSDVDGNNLSYLWDIVSKPIASNAELSNKTIVNPALIADADGIYEIQLIVNDGIIDSIADTVFVISSTANSTPVSNAGPDQNVNIGSTVRLDGNSSTDADLDSLSYHWSITSKPKNSNASLSDTSILKPTMVADLNGTYVIQLIVNDGLIDSIADTMSIFSQKVNSLPVANAGLDQGASINDSVKLSGSATDADLDTLTYSWSFTSKPDGSIATLSDSSRSNPIFIADKSGEYILQLIVNDSLVDSLVDTVVIDATYVTTKVSNVADFRLALLNAATNNQNDKIVLENGIYKTTGDGQGTFVYSSNESYKLFIIGSSANNVVLSGENTDKVLSLNGVNNSTPFILEKIAITNGKQGLWSSSNLSVRDCNISNNHADTSGGGMQFSGEVLLIENSIFNNNSAYHYDYETVGGGFYTSSASSVMINNSIFSDNSAYDGGGFYSSSGSIMINNSTFYRNRADSNLGTGSGGGFRSYGNTIIKKSIFFQNYAYLNGGGFFARGDLKVNGSIFNGNGVGYFGGGIYIYQYFSFEISNSLFINNGAGRDGASIRLQQPNNYSAKNLIVNNIFTSSRGTDISDYKGSRVVLKNNFIDFRNLDIDASYTSSDNIFDGKDTSFVDEANDDFHLTSNSDLIDTGLTSDPDIEISKDDLDGVARPQIGSTDIGPYEYQP